MSKELILERELYVAKAKGQWLKCLLLEYQLKKIREKMMKGDF